MIPHTWQKQMQNLENSPQYKPQRIPTDKVSKKKKLGHSKIKQNPQIHTCIRKQGIMNNSQKQEIIELNPQRLQILRSSDTQYKINV